MELLKRTYPEYASSISRFYGMVDRAVGDLDVPIYALKLLPM